MEVFNGIEEVEKLIKGMKDLKDSGITERLLSKGYRYSDDSEVEYNRATISLMFYRHEDDDYIYIHYNGIDNKYSILIDNKEYNTNNIKDLLDKLDKVLE